MFLPNTLMLLGHENLSTLKLRDGLIILTPSEIKKIIDFIPKETEISLTPSTVLKIEKSIRDHKYASPSDVDDSEQPKEEQPNEEKRAGQKKSSFTEDWTPSKKKSNLDE